jgi:hypothetical protein
VRSSDVAESMYMWNSYWTTNKMKSTRERRNHKNVAKVSAFVESPDSFLAWTLRNVELFYECGDVQGDRKVKQPYPDACSICQK